MMTGSSGTSKTGKTYRYYVCTNAKKKLCDKKNVGKEFIEDLVVRKCRELLTDENIEIIAKAVVEVAERDIEHSNVSRLEKLIADNERAVGNLMKALEAGEIVEQITARIREKNQEKAELQQQLAEENALHIQLTVPQVKFFLTQLRDGKADNIEYRKTLITVLVNAIYLYDDKVTFILNVGDKPVEITEELLDDIENNAGVLPLKGKVHHEKEQTFVCSFSLSPVRADDEPTGSREATMSPTPCRRLPLAETFGRFPHWYSPFTQFLRLILLIIMRLILLIIKRKPNKKFPCGGQRTAGAKRSSRSKKRSE